MRLAVGIEYRAVTRSRAGFTMGEMVAALAVLVALMAVAFPNVVSYQRSLAHAQLDGKAEQVYNAVQFQLSTLETAGRLSALAPLDDSKVSPAPADYSGAKGADALRYAVKGATVTSAYLMPADKTPVSASVASGSYAIELSPGSAEVYAVYYWEDDAEDADGAKFAGTTPAAIEEFYKSVSRYRPSNSTFLADHGIGYFSGGAVSEVGDRSAGGKSVFELAELKMGVENGENLAVTLSYPFSFASTDFDADALRLSLHVKQVGGADENQVMIRMNGGAGDTPAMSGDYDAGRYIDVTLADFTQDAGRLSYVLDSLKEDGGQPQSIERRTANYIKRGSDVQIWMYAEYEGAKSESGPEKANTLFLSYDSDAHAIEANCMRHLVNLADGGVLKGQATNLKLTSDIAFDSEDASGGFIAPIDLSGTFDSTGSVSIDGNNCVIEGFVIGGENDPSDDAGLFQNLGASVQNLVLKDFTVRGKSNVGALAGSLAGGISIENCQVAGSEVTGAENVGGLIGAQTGNVSIQDCQVAGGKVAGETSVGGLVGSAKDGAYEGCSSSAEVVTANVVAGGFVGAAGAGSGATTFESCKAGSPSSPIAVEGQHNPGEGSFVGGFVGRLDASNVVRGCQAYANVTGYDYVGGFIGITEAGSSSTVDNCEAPVTYNDEGDPVFQRASGRIHVGGFAGNVRDFASLRGCLAQLDVSGSGDGSDFVGGFAGSIAESGVDNVSDCRVLGVEHDGATRQPTYSCPGENAGGFAGAYPDDLANCLSTAVRA